MTSRALFRVHRRTVSLLTRRREVHTLNATSPRGRCDGGRRQIDGRHRRHILSSAASVSSSSSATSFEEDTRGTVADSKIPKICILGGGFGGLYTAVKLDGLMWPKGNKPEVTLIDQSDRFVFKPLLYEILTGTAEEFEVAPFFHHLLEPFQTQFVQARVKGVDVSTEANEGGMVLLDDGREIRYDWLVIAIGARANFYGIPGIKEHAVPFNTFEDVQKIIASLKEITTISDRHGRVVVVGGGYAGVELAAAVSAKIDQLRKGQSRKTPIDVTLITDTDAILQAAPLSQRQAAEEQLNKAGIQIQTGYLVEGIEERTDGDRSTKIIRLVTAGSRKEATSMNADLVLWTAGSTPSTRSDASDHPFPFERTAFGALRTESTMRLVQQKRVFALGDDAFIDDPKSNDDRLPATAQVALQQADYVAWNLWAAINDRPLLPFRYQHLGDMMSLGSQNAAIALPFSLPKQLTEAIRGSPIYGLTNFIGLELGEGDAARDRRLTVDGPLAAFVRRLAYWYRQPTNEHKAKIATDYFEKIAKFLSAPSRGNASQ